MSILIDESTQVLVQGITGKEGSFHTQRMIEYGTRVVAGVTPGKGGNSLDGVPIYNTVMEAVNRHRIDAAVVFVPARYATDAISEEVDAKIPLIVCITEGIPLHQMLRTYEIVRSHGAKLIGPNCPGLLSAGKSKIGIIPGQIFKSGPVGVVSRSGTLTYEIVDQLTKAGIGQTTAVGIGGDPVIGSSFIDILELFERDPETQLVVMVGEIGGSDEEQAAEFISRKLTKPVISYIAGFSAPPGKRMGHAGAIITGSSGTAEAKAKALEAKGIPVARTPRQIVELVKQKLRKA
ncbi:MAG: succinate--CoA ligase subunit alpha [Candidatus Fraserbacteria bacterium RBG_16_55_9]|uniref:Succinate--CoA ligase [ADP-forming] subunit alpha n=1 Tax=Fraserbacteria sp. (strain RBG_16_55_9) TaxID=1817864 RepID=A0A1F5UX49_FRAXR|nr:MAG: succinate--CoA ligase subunit alpha [Candidatus Fraserbacteria bacterium RBG_16_55_9]